MKIIIEDIPHAQQRYPTCGDWYVKEEAELTPNGGHREPVLHIKVSREMGPDSCFLVAIHELIECHLAMRRGVTVQQVDDFDTAYEKAHREGGTLEGKRLDESEPGDDPTCPVFKEHGLATGIEGILCAEMGIPWSVHQEAVEELP